MMIGSGLYLTILTLSERECTCFWEIMSVVCDYEENKPNDRNLFHSATQDAISIQVLNSSTGVEPCPSQFSI